MGSEESPESAYASKDLGCKRRALGRLKAAAWYWVQRACASTEMSGCVVLVMYPAAYLVKIVSSPPSAVGLLCRWDLQECLARRLRGVKMLPALMRV